MVIALAFRFFCFSCHALPCLLFSCFPCLAMPDIKRDGLIFSTFSQKNVSTMKGMKIFMPLKGILNISAFSLENIPPKKTPGFVESDIKNVFSKDNRNIIHLVWRPIFYPHLLAKKLLPLGFIHKGVLTYIFSGVNKTPPLRIFF